MSSFRASSNSYPPISRSRLRKPFIYGHWMLVAVPLQGADMALHKVVEVIAGHV